MAKTALRVGEDTAAGRAVWLRRDAERIGGALPPLLAEAQRLAATILTGAHGRRRTGPGEEFWQYRQALPGDVASAIDWRRSARSDTAYIREMEWDAAQTVTLWCDRSAAMDYRSDPKGRSKGERAKLLSLAIAVLLGRAGERVALMESLAAEPRAGESHLRALGYALAQPVEAADYGAAPPWPDGRGGQAVFLSDFLGDLAPLEAALASAAQRGVRGVLLQINDPAEEAFPFDGRVRFEAMSGPTRFETDRARGLHEAYTARLAERRDALEALARGAGWQFGIHRTDESPRKALLWAYTLIGGVK
ncbi:MAG: DUF58 domain-containing protein [Pseudomonadota bacterium]